MLPADFGASIASATRRLRGRVADASPAAVWGAASKGVIFALYMERAGTPVDLIIDINPAKQGKYLAATGLRVHSPAEAMESLAEGSEVLVMNPNYLHEIRQMSGRRFNYLTLDHDTV